MAESLLWFLLFGALFYFLMKKGGCGMHAHGGHQGHGGHSGHGGDPGRSDKEKVQDPVCGMTIKKNQAAHSLEHQGQIYYFCSEHCFDTFKREPSRYVPPGGHHH